MLWRLWLSGLLGVLVLANDIQLRVTVRKEILIGVSACIHAISHVELWNTVSSLN
jgi:hypothetical protein